MKNLNTNQKLVVLVIALGFIAVVIGNPFDNRKVNVDLQELALVVSKAQDHITVNQLADWIIAEKSDYVLVDIRTPQEFEVYHIPGAINIPLAALLDSDLKKNDKVIIYSEGGIHSAQAWFFLRSKGFKQVYFIIGGLDDWKNQILYPILPFNANSQELAKFEKQKEVSKFFGGTPMVADSSSSQASALQSGSPNVNMPKITPPASTGGAPKAGGQKKKKEGC